MNDKNISPVGWYIGSYLIRFIEMDNSNNKDLDERFHAWENTILVKAKNLDEAYDKVVRNAKLGTKPYRGGPQGIPVKWEFEGVTELLPVYEEIEDGSELMWREHSPTKLKNLRKLVKMKSEFKQ